ncbi:MAG: homoserine dehydrogenase [Ktedonobacteraceae bacterium]
MIIGIGSRSRGLFIYPDGINVDVLAREQDPLSWHNSSGNRMENFETFIEAGKRAGVTLFIELTTLNPHDGQPALSYIRKALTSSMDVITANKGPIAFAQKELQSLARRQNVQLRFESTVMDGLPLINMVEFTLPAVGIQSFKATLNTTSTLVLNMIEQGYSLEEAIVKAQEIGVTETDPWYDLDGWDAVMKTTILANSLLDGNLTPQMVEREGIRDLTSDEICAAAMAGSPYRLVSQAHRKNGVLFAEVRPCRIGSDDTLHIGKGTTGVISIETEAMGTLTFVEHEPAIVQTAYGVLSDLITIQRKRSK